MTKVPSHSDPRSTEHTPTQMRVPAGAPRWITSELIALTIRVWQPFYPDQLIPEDALVIITGVSRMVDILSGGDHETVRSPGPSQQS